MFVKNLMNRRIHLDCLEILRKEGIKKKQKKENGA